MKYCSFLSNILKIMDTSIRILCNVLHNVSDWQFTRLMIATFTHLDPLKVCILWYKQIPPLLHFCEVKLKNHSVFWSNSKHVRKSFLSSVFRNFIFTKMGKNCWVQRSYFFLYVIDFIKLNITLYVLDNDYLSILTQALYNICQNHFVRFFYWKYKLKFNRIDYMTGIYWRKSRRRFKDYKTFQTKHFDNISLKQNSCCVSSISK